MEDLLSNPKAFIASMAALAVAGAAIRIIKAIFSPRVVEWAVMRALAWLAKQSQSNADDELVAVVRESLEAEPADLAEASGDSAKPVCPTCSQPLP